MTHIVVGYPSISQNEKIIDVMVKNGIKRIELQIPFSDPLADGSVIAKACKDSLKNGTKVKNAFSLMKKLTNKYPEVSFYFMTYYNIVFNYDVEKFCHDTKTSGAKGIIAPDMPIDEEKYENFFSSCKKENISPIFVISPITPDNRLKIISKYAKDFLYCTSVIGTTGVRKKVNSNLKQYVNKIRKYFDIPIAIGFGLSTKTQIQEVFSYADIAIVGSAILKEDFAGQVLKIEEISAF